MDYHILAEELIDLQSKLLKIPASQRLASLAEGELFVLNYLQRHQNTAHPKELSQGLVVSTARIAALLNRMEAQGIITRTPDPADNRQVIVTLTQAGRRMIRRKRAEIVALAARTLELLGPEDAQAYLRIQAKILCNFMNSV